MPDAFMFIHLFICVYEVSPTIRFMRGVDGTMVNTWHVLSPDKAWSLDKGGSKEMSVGIYFKQKTHYIRNCQR